MVCLVFAYSYTKWKSEYPAHMNETMNDLPKKFCSSQSESKTALAAPLGIPDRVFFFEL